VKILSFHTGDYRVRGGVLVDDEHLVDIAELAELRSVQLPTDVRELVAVPDVVARLHDLMAEGREALPSAAIRNLDQVVLKAPLRPGKVVGVGLNYVAHVEESRRTLDTAKDLPTRPVLFSKPATAVVGHGEPIRHNSALTSELDWECELAVVIGRRASQVTAGEALDHVFGSSIINDVSARDQRRSGQWFFSKGQDSYAPFGPWIVTADEIADPQALDFRLTVNGDEKQNSNTRYMLFTIAQLIEDISSGVTLEPGDVIATGSAEGVGAGLVPPQYLQPGDVVELTIDKIGTLTNPVVAV